MAKCCWLLSLMFGIVWCVCNLLYVFIQSHVVMYVFVVGCFVDGDNLNGTRHSLAPTAPQYKTALSTLAYTRSTASMPS